MGEFIVAYKHGAALVPMQRACESIQYNPPPYQGGARGGLSVIIIQIISMTSIFIDPPSIPPSQGEAKSTILSQPQSMGTRLKY